MANNLKIKDDEFIFSEKILLAYLNTSAEISYKYCKIIEKINDGAFTDVLISTRLKDLMESMNQIHSYIVEISESLQGKTKAFIIKIDEKDDFIY